MWMPYKPMTVTDAINHYAAATGSPAYAQSCESAHYMGYRAWMNFNDVRGYWIAEYTWAGRRVIARGSFEEVLGALVRFQEGNGKGGCVSVYCTNDAEVAACEAVGMVPWSKEADEAAYNAVAWWGTEVSSAFRLQQQVGIPAVHMLATSNSLDEYRAKVDAYCKKEKPA